MKRVFVAVLCVATFFFVEPTYASPLDGFNSWKQSRALARLAESIESRLEKAPVAVATELYLLEIRALALLESIGNRGGKKAVRDEALATQKASIRRILRLSERVRAYAIEKADEVLAPEPERRLSESEGGRDAYEPIYRGLPGRADGTERTDTEAIRDMEAAQREKGINTVDTHDISSQSLSELDSGQLAEWVQFSDSKRIVFSKDGAKHPVIARGKTVGGAGSLKVFKDRKGTVLLAIVSPTSGNYKPSFGSTEALVQALASAGVPESSIIVTETAPADTANVKLLMRVKGNSKELIQKRMSKLEAYKKPKSQSGFNATLLKNVSRAAKPFRHPIKTARQLTKLARKKQGRTPPRRQ